MSPILTKWCEIPRIPLEGAPTWLLRSVRDLPGTQPVHRRAAQGRTARAPRGRGVSAHRRRTRRTARRIDARARRSRAGRGVLRLPRLPALPAGLSAGRGPGEDARRPVDADPRRGPRHGRPAGAVRRAHHHAAAPSGAGLRPAGVLRGDRGRPSQGRGGLRHRPALVLRHPRRLRCPGRRSDALPRARPAAGRARQPRARRRGARGAPVAVRPALRRGPAPPGSTRCRTPAR